MRLQQLELKGFKSFAQETAIHFGEDVIGIVGPNGSGKSNIVDAIRWVLGEQKSRELRLDQMSSVIFNGTKNRKAGGMAQVSLTFENTRNLLPTEYNTITVTRRLYRSGESEYLLNGVTCRLKDITSLFLDTGIGSNSYAIIALGMVDDILADKDNARRRMFEQAAGISKYKVRKRETINKLNNTTADLDRVEDLLFEIEKNLNTLEKQAKRTRRYFELKEEYKALRIDLSLMQVADLKVQHARLKKQLETEEDTYRGLDVKADTLESELEAARKQNLDKEKALSDSQRELNQLVGLIREREGERRMLEQRQQFVAQNQEKMRQGIEETTQRLQRVAEAIQNSTARLEEEKGQETTLEQELAEANDHLARIKERHGSVRQALDEVLAQQQSLEREIFELEKQKAIQTNQVQNYARELEQSKEQMAARRKELDGIQDELQSLQGAEDEQGQVLDSLEQAERERQDTLEETQGLVEQHNQELQKVNRDLDAKRNAFQLTKSMVEKLEGFPESIRFLSQQKGWKQKAPLLADLIYVQEDYRVAIENYLDNYLNYYVVRHLEEARQAIDLLSRSQKGKANFFLLDAFQARTPNITLLPGTARATDVVEVDPAYRDLFDHLLGHVLIADEEDLLEGPPPQEGVVLLARSGRIIKGAFSISGGSVGLFEGKKIGRKKNLEHLQTAIAEAEKKSDNLTARLFKLREQANQLKAQAQPDHLRAERQKLNAMAQKRVSQKTRLENLEAYIREAREKVERLQRLIAERENDIADFEGKLASKRSAVDQIKAEIARKDNHVQGAADELSQASSAYNEKNIQFIRQQNKVNALERERAFQQAQETEANNQLHNARQSLAQGEAENAEIDDKLGQLNLALKEDYELKKQREATLTEVEQLYFKARGAINDREEELRKLNKARQQAQVLINNLKDSFNDVKYQISAVAQRLRIEFELDINAIIDREPETKLPQHELESKVERLKKRLDNYGEINPMAVEAYDEMHERYTSISKQRDDILQAKESLLETIREIEETATQQFLQAFNQVREHFVDVFRSLFTEDDNCDLILLEPEDPLESKIEITAKPKGKRPQTINQLSGGEKTLTSIALLFALYLLKPAPFCIFDEVDAPLDDANIMKFNRIVKKFSKESQFIIVTHNKLTMAAVDTIYGVYMAEQGVSGVSQVDFRDFEHAETLQVGG